MNNWFTVKVKYTKQLDSGNLKRVSEPFLLSAMSFTDSESRIYEELEDVVKGEFSVVSMARTEIHDIFNYDDSYVWYACQIEFENFEDGEKSKKVKQNFLVGADSVVQAHQRLKEELSTLMVDFEILKVIKSPIVDIFPLKEDLDKELSRTSIEEAN
jgi:hypothetical protein